MKDADKTTINKINKARSNAGLVITGCCWKLFTRILSSYPFSYLRLVVYVYVLKIASSLGIFVSERVVEYPWVMNNLPPPPLKVLDIGSAGSFLTYELARRGYEVYSLDVLPMPFKHKNLQILQGDITRMPFKNRTFGTTIAVSTLEHVGLGYYGDPIQRDGDVRAINEISGVTIKKGLIILTLPYNPVSSITWQRTYDEDMLKKLFLALFVRTKEYFVIGAQKKWKRILNQKYIAPNERGIVCIVASNEEPY